MAPRTTAHWPPLTESWRQPRSARRTQRRPPPVAQLPRGRPRPASGEKGRASFARSPLALYVVTFATGTIRNFPINQVLRNSRSVIGIELGGWLRRDALGYHLLVDELMALVAAGTLHPFEPLARALEEARHLLADLQARATGGKAVLIP